MLLDVDDSSVFLKVTVSYQLVMIVRSHSLTSFISLAFFLFSIKTGERSPRIMSFPSYQICQTFFMHEERNYTIRKIVVAHKVNYKTFNMLALTVLTVLLWMFEKYFLFSFFFCWV